MELLLLIGAGVLAILAVRKKDEGGTAPPAPPQLEAPTGGGGLLSAVGSAMSGVAGAAPGVAGAVSGAGGVSAVLSGAGSVAAAVALPAVVAIGGAAEIAASAYTAQEVLGTNESAVVGGITGALNPVGSVTTTFGAEAGKELDQLLGASGSGSATTTFAEVLFGSVAFVGFFFGTFGAFMLASVGVPLYLAFRAISDKQREDYANSGGPLRDYLSARDDMAKKMVVQLVQQGISEGSANRAALAFADGYQHRVNELNAWRYIKSVLRSGFLGSGTDEDVAQDCIRLGYAVGSYSHGAWFSNGQTSHILLAAPRAGLSADSVKRWVPLADQEVWEADQYAFQARSAAQLTLANASSATQAAHTLGVQYAHNVGAGAAVQQTFNVLTKVGTYRWLQDKHYQAFFDAGRYMANATAYVKWCTEEGKGFNAFQMEAHQRAGLDKGAYFGELVKLTGGFNSRGPKGAVGVKAENLVLREGGKDCYYQDGAGNLGVFIRDEGAVPGAAKVAPFAETSGGSIQSVLQAPHRVGPAATTPLAVPKPASSPAPVAAPRPPSAPAPAAAPRPPVRPAGQSVSTPQVPTTQQAAALQLGKLRKP